MFYGFLLGFFTGVIVGVMSVTGWLIFWRFDDLKSKMKRLKEYESK